MNRVVPLLLLVLAGCRRDEAVQALIQVDPQLVASCVVLEVTDAQGQVLDSKSLPRTAERPELRVAIFRGGLPEDIQLRVRALWGTGCTEPLAYNGLSAPVSVRFAAGTQSVPVTVSPPGPAEDADRDGFVAAERGGPDCDDGRLERRPNREELCDASDDLNCDGLRGCDDATCSGRVCSRFPTALVFTPPTLTATAGQCARVTVERRDSTGALNLAGFATPLTLTNALPAGVAFFSDANCSAAQPPPTSIPASTGSVTFYVRGTTVGEGSLSASSPALTSATFTQSLRPAQVTKLAFTTPIPPTSRAGDCYVVTLEARDAYDNLSPTALASVTLTPPATPAEAAFYKDAACAQVLDPATLPAAPTQSFYFRATRATAFALQGKSSGTNVQSTQQNWNIKPRPTSKITYTPATLAPLMAGQCSPQVHVKLMDEFNNLSPLPVGQVLTVTTTPSDVGFELFAAPGCTTLKLPGTIDPVGNAEGDIWFKAKTGVSLEIKTAGLGGLETRQTQVIIPAVRRGTCRMEVGEATKSCPVNVASYSTAQVDTSRAFVVFQASSDHSSPSSSFIRCALTPTTVECKRSTSLGAAIVQWQVVELLQGLAVRHMPDVPCAGSVNLSPAVAEASTFVLFSSSQDGDTVDQNDFPSLLLLGPTQLSTAMQVGCNGNHFFNLQFVQFTNSQVIRGATGSMTTDMLSVQTTASDPSRTFLLSTWQASGGTSEINKRLLRAEIDTNAEPPQLRFTRGADASVFTSADVPQIAWERITLPAGMLVQTKRLTVLDGEATTVVPLSTPVDPTRTLVLSSAQAGGQGMGETSYTVDDILGVGAGRLTLPSGTQLSVTRDKAAGKTLWTAYAIQFEP